MSAWVAGNCLYMSKDLAAKVTPRERRVVLAHELSHWEHKDHLKMLFIKLIAFFSKDAANEIIKAIEARADREAIMRSKDPSAFKSLLYKLNRTDDKYPTKAESIKMANDMAGKL